MPRTQGNPIEWPAEHNRQRAGRGDMADALGDLVEAFSRLAGMVGRRRRRRTASSAHAGRRQARNVRRGRAPDAGECRLRSERVPPVRRGRCRKEIHDGRHHICRHLFFYIGRLRKVLMPAKCGSSPRANVGIDLSTIGIDPGRPISTPISVPCASRPRAVSFRFDGLPALHVADFEVRMVETLAWLAVGEPGAAGCRRVECLCA